MRTYYQGYWIDVECLVGDSGGWQAIAAAGLSEPPPLIELVADVTTDSEFDAQYAALRMIQEAIRERIQVERFSEVLGPLGPDCNGP